MSLLDGSVHSMMSISSPRSLSSRPMRVSRGGVDASGYSVDGPTDLQPPNGPLIQRGSAKSPPPGRPVGRPLLIITTACQIIITGKSPPPSLPTWRGYAPLVAFTTRGKFGEGVVRATK